MGFEKFEEERVAGRPRRARNAKKAGRTETIEPACKSLLS